MNRPTARRVDNLLLTLLIIVLSGALVTAWQWYRAAHDYRQWQRALAGEALSVGASANEQIARALYLGRQGEFEEALKLNQQVEAAAGDADTVRIARFNSANLNLQEAFTLTATDQPGRALPLIEVAKQIYRQLLQEEPADWDSRYNLSRALLLAPDPVDEPEAIAPPDDAERAITTMKGYAPGMP